MSRSKTNFKRAPVVIIGDESRADSLPSHLRLSKKFLYLPSIRIMPVSWKAKSKHYDIVIFTSRHALFDPRRIRSYQKVVVIGSQTKKAAQEMGWKSIISINQGNSDRLFRWLQKSVEVAEKSKSVLYPRSSLVKQERIKPISNLGYKVESPIAYRTQILKLSRSALLPFKNERLIVGFMSPSSWKSFKLSKIVDLKKGITLVAIGPTTAAAIRKDGFRALRAVEPSFKALLARCNRTARVSN